MPQCDFLLLPWCMLQASRALQRPLTLPTAREAAAVDKRHQAQHSSAQHTSLSAAAASIAAGLRAAVADTTRAAHHPAGTSPHDSQAPGAGAGAAGSGSGGGGEAEPAMEGTAVDPEGAGGPGSEPEVTRRTAGDVSRAFGQAPPEVST